MLYFDQEKVLIPALSGEQHRRFELSPELKGRFWGGPPIQPKGRLGGGPLALLSRSAP